MAFIILENIPARFLDCRLNFSVICLKFGRIRMDDTSDVLFDVRYVVLPDAKNRGCQPHGSHQKFPAMVLVKPVHTAAKPAMRQVIRFRVGLQGVHVCSSRLLQA
jgi:hypothetical protein